VAVQEQNVRIRNPEMEIHHHRLTYYYLVHFLWARFRRLLIWNDSWVPALHLFLLPPFRLVQVEIFAVVWLRTNGWVRVQKS
jgi:hypothetical protein